MPKRGRRPPKREEDPAPLPPPRSRPLAPVVMGPMPSPAEAMGQLLSLIVESNSAPPGTRAVSLYCSIPMECPACKTMVPAWTKHRCQQ